MFLSFVNRRENILESVFNLPNPPSHSQLNLTPWRGVHFQGCLSKLMRTAPKWLHACLMCLSTFSSFAANDQQQPSLGRQFRKWVDSSSVQLSCSHWAKERTGRTGVSSWRMANSCWAFILEEELTVVTLNGKKGISWIRFYFRVEIQQHCFGSHCFFVQSWDAPQTPRWVHFGASYSIWKEKRVCISSSLHWPLGDLQLSLHAAFNPAKSLEARGWQFFLDFFPQVLEFWEIPKGYIVVR